MTLLLKPEFELSVHYMNAAVTELPVLPEKGDRYKRRTIGHYGL